MTDLSTLLAELDAAYEKMTPGPWVRVAPRDSSSFIKPIGAGQTAGWIEYQDDGPYVNGLDRHGIVREPDTRSRGKAYDQSASALDRGWGAIIADMEGIVALVNAYPQLREALRSLMHEKATDSWYTGWQVAVRERDEARAERNARARDVMHLEALVEQQREALRIVLNRAEQLFASDRPPPRACGRCGTPSAACDGDCADHVYIAQDLWKARAVLAAEVP